MIDEYLAFARGEGGEALERIDAARRCSSEVSEGAVRAGAEVRGRRRRRPGRHRAPQRPQARALQPGDERRRARRARRGRRARATPAGGVEILVDDDGPGIPPERFEEAFTPFGRLDEARNQNEKGVGLGLAIARDVARGHGGEVDPGPPPAGRPARGGAAAGAARTPRRCGRSRLRICFRRLSISAMVRFERALVVAPDLDGAAPDQRHRGQPRRRRGDAGRFQDRPGGERQVRRQRRSGPRRAPSSISAARCASIASIAGHGGVEQAVVRGRPTASRRWRARRGRAVCERRSTSSGLPAPWRRARRRRRPARSAISRSDIAPRPLGRQGQGGVGAASRMSSFAWRRRLPARPGETRPACGGRHVPVPASARRPSAACSSRSRQAVLAHAAP